MFAMSHHPMHGKLGLGRSIPEQNHRRGQKVCPLKAQSTQPRFYMAHDQEGQALILKKNDHDGPLSQKDNFQSQQIGKLDNLIEEKH